MTIIILNKASEQVIYITVGAKVYQLRIYAFRELMYYDIAEGETNIASGQRVMANIWLLPNNIGIKNGNIRFESNAADRDDYIWWEKFNDSYRLMAYNQAEYKKATSNGDV